MYIAIDGDDIGRKLTQVIYETNNENEVSSFSKLVAETFDSLADWVKINGGKVFICTGDSILISLDDDRIRNLIERLPQKPFTVSAGIGFSVREAHWALNVSKSMGKNRVTHFSEVKKMFISDNA